MIWTLNEYDEIAPIILSPAENEEISIKQVADAIVKAVGFEGDYKVCEGAFRLLPIPADRRKVADYPSLTHRERMVNSESPPRMRSS